MKTHLYTISWNEVDMLGFFFRHFDPWIDRYVIYDDGSTDGTLEMLHAHPRVEVRKFARTDPDSFVASHQKLMNNTWKGSRKEADWVVLTAIDEHLHVAGIPMKAYLERCRSKGVTVLHCMGFQMVSEEFPQQDELLWQTRTVGCPYARLSRLSIFNPKAVRKTNFTGGQHGAHPEGNVRLPSRDELLNLHYKNIGFERLFRRHRQLKQGLGPKDKAQSWSKKYDWTPDKFRRDWDLFANNAVDLAASGFKPVRCHWNRRWWRPTWKLLNRLGLISSNVLFLPRSPNESWAD